MSKHKTIKLLFVILLSIKLQVGNAQKRKRSIFIDPIQFFGMYNASFNFGYIIETNKLDYEIDLGIILPHDPWSRGGEGNPTRKNNKGFEIGFTPRYNLKNSYLGLFTAYSFHKYESHRYLSQTNLTITKYDVNQQVISCYLNFGGFLLSEKNSFTDGSIGVGLRLVNIQNNSSTPVSQLSEYDRLTEYFEKEENGWHLLLGIKDSYRIGLAVK